MASARAFVAWQVPPAAKARLGEAQAALRVSFERDGGGTARWEPADRLHATLHFLGDVEESTLPSLGAALRRVAADVDPFELVLDGYGAFPARGAPRVLFASVGSGADALRSLAAATHAALVPLGGAAPDKPFHPHVTFARVKHPPRRSWRMPAALSPVRCRVEGVALYRSRLAPGGAVHTLVAEAPLRGR